MGGDKCLKEEEEKDGGAGQNRSSPVSKSERKCCSCDEELDDEVEPSTIRKMRIFGMLLVVFSVTEIGFGIGTPDFGCWWAGILPIVIGVCGVETKK